MFALSNGHIGMRGSFEEGEPRGVARHLSQRLLRGAPAARTPRRATASPSTARRVVNVTDGKLIRLLVEDSPLDLRYGVVPSHDRTLDLRSGTLRRSPSGGSPTWPASASRRAAGVVHPARRSPRSSYEVEAARRRALTSPLQSDLLANEDPSRRRRRPAGRGAAGPAAASRACTTAGPTAPCSCTAPSAVGCGSPPGWTTQLELPDGAVTGDIECDGDLGPDDRSPAISARRAAAAGEVRWPTAGRAAGPLRHCGTRSTRRSAVAKLEGWDILAARQREYLDRFWARSDVEVDGDAEPCSRRYGSSMFHVLQAGARSGVTGHPRQGPDRARIRRSRVLGHRDVRAPRADLHGPGRRRGRADAGGTGRCRRHGPVPRSWA